MPSPASMVRGSPRQVSKSHFKAHALIWWAGGDHQRLSAAAREAIDQEIDSVLLPGGTSGLLVSAISCWEVAMLVNRGRLALSLEVNRWLALLAAHPAERLVAQARTLAVPLVRGDSKIRSYAHVRSLW